MISQTRYVVIYKDSAKARNKLFGTYVSRSMAEEFMDELPEPLSGGCKIVREMQPFSHDEARLASDVILASRQRGDLLEVIHEIVKSH